VCGLTGFNGFLKSFVGVYKLAQPVVEIEEGVVEKAAREEDVAKR